MNKNDLMKKAIVLAQKGRGRTSPNPLVGALIIKNGRIIAQGWHQKCGGPHAEIVALKKAGRRAKGAELYVTLEPCFHVGRTPPCVDAVIKSEIKKVYIGMKDPNPLTNGRSVAKLKRAGIRVEVGFLKKELEVLNESFIKYIKKRIPFVVAKTAQTLDGKIATITGRSKWITSAATRNLARKRRGEFDAILVGIETVLKDDPSLNVADRTKKIKKIVVDSTLRISPNAKLFRKTRPQDCFVAVTRKANKRKLNLLKNKGINVIICSEKDGHVDLRWLFRQLAKQRIASVLIEGGAHVIGSALKRGLVDKMHIYIAPKIFGCQDALSSVVGLTIASVGRAVQLKNLQIERIGEEIFLQGYV